MKALLFRRPSGVATRDARRDAALRGQSLWATLLALLVWPLWTGCEPATHTVAVAGEAPAPGAAATTLPGQRATASNPITPGTPAAGDNGLTTSAFGEAIAPAATPTSGDGPAGDPGGTSPPPANTGATATGATATGATATGATAGAGGSAAPVDPADADAADDASSVLIPTGTLPTPTTTSPACLLERATPRRVELYLLVDRVFSLPLANPLDLIDQGLREFIRSPRVEDTSAAMLAVRNLCNPDFYQAPDVGWGLLPDIAAAIEQVIWDFSISVTQAEAAIGAAFSHARARAVANPDDQQIVVLVTDGLDYGICPGATSETTQAIAAQGLAGDPAIPLYVVALGTSAFNPLTLIPGSLSLSGLAEAGGTGRPEVADIGAGAGAVADALDDVRVEAQPCEYEVPDGMASPQLHLDGDDQPLRSVADADACGIRQGFYMKPGAEHDYLVACPTSCLRIKSMGHDRVLIGPTCD